MQRTNDTDAAVRQIRRIVRDVRFSLLVFVATRLVVPTWVQFQVERRDRVNVKSSHAIVPNHDLAALLDAVVAEIMGRAAGVESSPVDVELRPGLLRSNPGKESVRHSMSGRSVDADVGAISVIKRTFRFLQRQRSARFNHGNAAVSTAGGMSWIDCSACSVGYDCPPVGRHAGAGCAALRRVYLLFGAMYFHSATIVGGTAHPSVSRPCTDENGHKDKEHPQGSRRSLPQRFRDQGLFGSGGRLEHWPRGSACRLRRHRCGRCPGRRAALVAKPIIFFQCAAASRAEGHAADRFLF